MDTFLNYLDNAVTLVTITLLAFSISRKFSSTTVALVVMTIVQAASYTMTGPIIDDLSDYDIELARIAHYFGFAFIDLLAIYACLRIHRIFNIKISTFSKLVVFCYGLIALLQIARYFDRSLGFDILGYFYHHAIPAVNIILVSVALYYVISDFTKTVTSQNVKGFMDDL